MRTRPVWAEISRSALLANYHTLRSLAGESAGLLAVVKANAYGHGLLQCAPLLAAAAPPPDWLGVTSVEEGASLRSVCAEARVLVMSGVWHGEGEAAIDHSLTTEVWEPFHIDELEAAARRRGLGPRSVPVHLALDTGMSRQGVRAVGGPNEALASVLARFTPNSPLLLEGVMTHFSASDDLDTPATGAQIACLGAALDVVAAHGLRPRWMHVGASATLLAGRDIAGLAQLAAAHGARLMVRPGLALYGYATRFSGHASETPLLLRPVLEWKARVVSLRTVEPGEGAGYNSTFRAARRSRLALLPLGYADGVNRRLSNTGSVLVRGQKAPIAGRISMDQTIVDVTDIAGVEIGDEAVLLGRQGGQSVTAYDLADLLGTIPYEVLCAIHPRVRRVPVD